MIVDDDLDDRFFFHKAVNTIDATYECMEAENCENALRQLRLCDRLPDFIFLDLNMPRMDGKQCLQELKKDERLKNTPVIIYSTSSFKRDIDNTRELGAAHFLTKISDISKLPGMITSAIELASIGISIK
ncbi:MAG TPA: response regulator [Bacteroidia bacterium]|nr:response regulator [Bacteroidia bacterium]